MHTLRLEGTSLNISGIGLGFWRAKDNAELKELLHTAYGAGITFFDHADIYGKGECEKSFGTATAWTAKEREGYCIQTKCGIRPEEGGKYYDNSSAHIVASVEASLRCLRTEYIDILLLHRPDALMEADAGLATNMVHGQSVSHERSWNLAL